MNKKHFLTIIAVFVVVVAYLAVGIQNNKEKNLLEFKKENMKITSPNFENNSEIPSKYTCNGENINPALIIADVPKNTESLALIVDDPDAPTRTWLHWSVWNINPGIKEIGEGSTPKGAVEGKTDFGNVGYGGPCPPSGTHRYFFKLYALNKKLDLQTGAELKRLIESMKEHIIERAELVGLYSQKQ